VDQALGQILQRAVWERLDMIEKLASSADNGSLLSLARSELPRLTHGWRALLATHAPDLRGRCPECSRHWRPRAAPCSVWRAAHERLVSAEVETVSSGSVASRPEARRVLPRMRRLMSLLPVRVPAGAGAAR
jgi:hypothetical protein